MGPAEVRVGRLDRRVRLEARTYRVATLCELLTATTDSRPQFKAAPSIQDANVRFAVREMVIWDLLERLFLDRGWTVDEQGEDTLLLQPAGKKSE